MVAQNIFFAIIAAAMIIAAVRVVTTRNVVHAALYLVLVLAGVAAQFILLLAEFVAIVQVLVYIGAVVVLFLFGIMLTRARIGQDVDLDNDRRWIAGITALGLFGVMGYTLWDAFEDTELPSNPVVQRTAEVSDSIFSTYLIAFEAVSILLLAALIGAIAIGRKE
ncbi:MAG: NADH-quinone oxidoreductase subunit J [Acidimicrobiales bacterium]